VVKQLGGGPGLQTAAGLGAGLLTGHVASSFAPSEMKAVLGQLGADSENIEQAGAKLQTAAHGYLAPGGEKDMLENMISSPVDAKMRPTSGPAVQVASPGVAPQPVGPAWAQGQAAPPTGLASPVGPTAATFAQPTTPGAKFGLGATPNNPAAGAPPAFVPPAAAGHVPPPPPGANPPPPMPGPAAQVAATAGPSFSPRGIPIPVDNLTSALADHVGLDQFGSLASSMTSSINPEVRNMLQGLLNDPGDRNWQDVKNMRTYIGKQMSNTANDATSPWPFIYESITKDMTEGADANNAGDEFKQYNSEMSALRDHAEIYLDPLVKSGVSPEQAFTLALKNGDKGGTQLQQILKAFPGQGLNSELLSGLLQTKPKMWNGLSDSMKAQLAPDEGLREQINAMMTKEPETNPLVAGMHNIGHMVAGGAAGEGLGLAAQHLSGSLSPSLVTGMHDLGTIGIPLVGAAAGLGFRAARNLITNPAGAKIPLQGAAAGAAGGGGEQP